jgi:hypothetical protein
MEEITAVVNDDMGAPINYPMQLVALDPRLNLALLAFSVTDPPLTSGLTIGGIAQKGDDVWAAGYPAINNQPDFRLNKGTISQPRFYDRSLNSNPVNFIVYDSQLYAGYDGGPLLKKMGEDNYIVLGLNIWQPSPIQAKTGQHIAVSGNDLKMFLNRASSLTPVANDELSFKRQATTFVNALNNRNSEQLAPLLGASVVANEGYDAFKQVAVNNSRDLWYQQLFISPLATLRQALALHINQQAKQQDIRYTLTNISLFSTITGQMATADFTSDNDNKVHSSLWQLGATGWQLQSSNLPLFKNNDKLQTRAVSSQKPNKNEKNEDGTNNSVAHFNGIAINAALHFKPNNKNIGFVGGLDVLSGYKWLYFPWGVRVFNNFTTHYSDNGTKRTELLTLIGLNAGVALRLPIHWGKVYVAPYGEYRLGTSFTAGQDGLRIMPYQQWNAGLMVKLANNLATSFDVGQILPLTARFPTNDILATPDKNLVGTFRLIFTLW